MLGLNMAMGLGAARASGGLVPPYPAPLGMRWVFVKETGIQVTESGVRVITLERAA